MEYEYFATWGCQASEACLVLPKQDSMDSKSFRALHGGVPDLGGPQNDVDGTLYYTRASAFTETRTWQFEP